MFKIVGVIAGSYLLGFFGAILGYILGAIIDRVRTLGTGGVNPFRNALRQTVFLETLFTLMGKLAKADGHISPDEIAHAELFMQKLAMTGAHRRHAIAWFRKGADQSFDIGPVYRRFMSVCGQTKDLKQVLLVYLIVTARADGHLHPAEEAVLFEIASQLGYDKAGFQRLIDMVLNQSHFGRPPVDPGAALDDAYRALGITRDSTDQEIKRAYRKLMSQYHPDKLIGQGLPEDMIAVATEQAKEIQLAYDLITKHKQMARASGSPTEA